MSIEYKTTQEIQDVINDAWKQLPRDGQLKVIKDLTQTANLGDRIIEAPNSVTNSILAGMSLDEASKPFEYQKRLAEQTRDFLGAGLSLLIITLAGMGAVFIIIFVFLRRPI